MHKKIPLVLFFLIAFATAKAQNCTIKASSVKICLGGTVTLSVTTPDVNDTAWNWNFGNGSTSTQRNPTYQYPNAGIFTITLTIYRRTGISCTATPLSVEVLHKPVAKYFLQNGYSQCFENNNFIFADSSKPGLSNAPIKKRVLVFDDGAINQENVPYNNSFSHKYTDAAGDKYRVVIEVTDSNNCINQYIDSVTVFPKREIMVFTASSDIKCNETTVEFKNLSQYDATNSRRIWWIVDSNVVFTSPWRTLTYTYKGNRTFQPKLVIEDNNGCIDSVDLGYDIISFAPDSSISVKSSNKSCFKNNEFRFSNPTLLGNFIWTITDANNKLVFQFSQPSFSHTFLTCGLFNVKLFYFYNGCTFESDTQVFVYGPAASMYNDSIKPMNWIQCTPKDTVYFNTPDLNCKYNNGIVQYLWNFNDPFAPPCTTSTRLGQNIGVNCNYSTDSLRVKHFYSHPNQYCYGPSLVLTDPLLGCSDVDSVSLRIGAPLAGWDSTVVPPLPRVYIVQNQCSRDVTFMLERLLPSCGPEEVWLLPDSACGNLGWIKIDTLGIRKQFKYSYLNLCDSTGHLVYGIVVINGKNAAGQTCYDTTWYHHKLDLAPPVDFDFVFQGSGLCKPYAFKFTPKDSTMQDLKEVTWFFADGTPIVRIPYTAPDSIIKPQSHVFANGGFFPVTFGITTLNGCFASKIKTIVVGKSGALQTSTPDLCAGVDAHLEASVFYNANPALDFWGDTVRRNQGKEQLYWDFGDSGKWILGLPRMVHQYANPGVYHVRVAFKDSTITGCFDTTSGASVTVRSIKAQIYQFTDTFYCAPTIVSFIDSSYTQDDTLSRQYNVFERAWNFGDDRPPSLLMEPSVFYGSNGIFKAKLYVESIYGCTDETEKEFVIIGPRPMFVIIQDTFGCSPFTVKLRNQTQKQLKNWIWYFNDALQTVLSTDKDTDVYFTYSVPGVYQIDLLGEEDVFNPVTGSFKNCTAKFPYVDASNPFHNRTVTVLKSDTLIIVSADKVCIDQVFTATVKDSFYVAMVEWVWGDSTANTPSAIKSLASHSYDSGGVYTLVVKPVITANGQCVLGAQKQIIVNKPIADFEYNLRSYPTFAFTNKSQSASRYLWDFGQPFSSSNSSTAKDPLHTFVIENNEYKVCLMAFDDLDCMDSVCKLLPVRSSIKIPNVFSPSNKDGKNDAFDIDIEGWSNYELFIYNRWGTLVFEGNRDGFYNDGVNWDGRNKNDGSDCPEGVYYVVFKYKLFNQLQDEVYHGTVTLIRE
ncbi:MAG: PKD domain-containing protein [Bacteroidota bacterium]